MKCLLIVLSVVSAATASLEPAGYKPPGSSSPTSIGRERYLPPSYQAASPRGVVTPETHYLPPNRQSLTQNVIPNSVYLPSNHPPTSTNSHNSVSPSSVGLLSEHYLPPPVSGPSHRVTSQYHHQQAASSGVRDRSSISHHVSSNSGQTVGVQHTANRNVVSSQYLPPLSSNSQRPTETFDHRPPLSTYLPANQNQYQQIQPPASVLPSNRYLTPNKFSNTSPGGFSGSHYEHSHSTSSSGSSNSHLNPTSLTQPAGHYYSNSAHSSGGYTYDQPPAKYQFDYHVNDEYGNDYSHKETRDGESTQGVYTVLLPDGRKQIVHYMADRNGYRPTITYENPQSGKSGYNQGYQY